MFNFLRKEPKSQPKYFPNISLYQQEISELLKHHPTPLFLIDQSIVNERFQSLKKFSIAYSFKTNYALAESSLVDRQSIIAEVVSEKEYLLAKKLRYKTIIYNGPYKSDTSLITAINDPHTFIHIDNLSQLKTFHHLDHSHHKKYGLRFNPQSTPSRFGFTDIEILDIASRFPPTQINALHIHLGSDIDQPDIYCDAVAKTNELITRLQHLNVQLDYVDFGGGFPSHGLPPFSKKNWHPQPIEKYLSKISQLETSKIILEPGRFLIDDATIFVTQVIDTKNTANRFQILCNASIDMLPLTNYRLQIVKAYHPDFSEYEFSENESIVYGATCQESDKLHQGFVARCQPGDYLIFFCTGAYNQSLGSNFIFTKPSTLVI